MTAETVIEPLEDAEDYGALQKPLARVLIAKPRSNVRSCQAKSFLDDHAELAIRRAVAQLVGVGVLGTGAVGAVGFRQLQQVLYDFPVPEPD